MPSASPKSEDVETAREAVRMASVLFGEIFAMDPSVFTSPTRGSPGQALARQIMMHVVNVSLGIPEDAIAEAIGRDPSTVQYATRLIEEVRDRPDFDAALEWIGERLVEFSNFRRAYARDAAQSPRSKTRASSSRTGSQR